MTAKLPPWTPRMTSVSAAQRVLMPSCLAAAPTGHTASSRPPRVAGGIGAIAGQLRDADADVVPIRPHITFSAARHCISLHRITSVNAIGDSRETRRSQTSTQARSSQTQLFCDRRPPAPTILITMRTNRDACTG